MKFQFLTPFLDIFKEEDRILFQVSTDKICYMSTIILYMLQKYKYRYIQIDLCDVEQSLDLK